MATYKGLGLDTTNARTRTGTSSDDIQFDALITAADGVTVSAVGLTVSAGGASITGGTSSDTLSVSGDASVDGDLTVTGDIVSRGAVDLVVQDNFIDLNFGNSTTTSEAGGLTVQMNRTSGFTAGTVTTFVAGVASTSNPTFTYTDATGSTAFAAGDVVVISGAAQSGNDGLFVVSSVNQASFPQIVTIKGIGTVAVDGATPWAQNQFEADTGDTATAYKTDLFIQLVADGSASFTDAGGSTYSKGTFLTAYHGAATESDFSADGGYTTVESTLQSAYNGGNTITTASSTDIALTLTSGGFTVNGAGAVDFGNAGTDVASFSVGTATFDVNATGAITLDGVGASNLTCTGAAMTLSGAGVNIAGGSAEIDITTTGALDINAAAATFDATGGLTAALSGAASSITSTSQDLSIATATSGELDLTAAGLMDINAAANLDIDVTGTFDMLSSGAFSIDGTGASNVTAASGNLTLSTTTSGDIDLSSAADVDVDGANIQLDATSGISLDAAAASNVTVDGADLTLSTTTSGNVDITAADDINLAAAGSDIDMDAATLTVDMTGAISLDAGAASNLTTSAGALTLDGNGGVNIAGNAAEVDITTTGAVDVNGAAITVDASGTLSFDAADSTNLTMVANDGSDKTLTIAATNGGGGNALVDISADGDTTINGANILLGSAGGTADVVLDGVNGTALVSTSGINIVAGVSIYEPLYISASGYDQADASSAATAFCVAIAAEAGAATNGKVLTASQPFVMKLSGAPSSVGQRVYLSTTAGEGTVTAPSASGNVVFQVGFVLSTTAQSGSNYPVLFQPQFIAEIG